MKNYNARTVINDLYTSKKVSNYNDAKTLLRSGEFSLSDGTHVRSDYKDSNYTLQVADQSLNFNSHMLRLMDIEIAG